ncbi:MAG: PadR family transcriptional regulator [Thermoleophilaceae bacterium]
MSSDKEFRLSATSYAVLGFVRYLGEATPYDLKRFLERSIENFWPVPHTTFYAEPTRLAGAGYLTESQESGGRRRKTYKITEKGERALDEWVAVTDGVAMPQLRDEGLLKVFFGSDPGPILRDRIRWHRAKQAELEGYLEDVQARGEGALTGPERTLRAGIRYHRALAEAAEEYLDQVGGG